MKADIGKYIGIPYRHLGRDWAGCDCLGLVDLFQRTEFGVLVPSFRYEKNWADQGLDLIRKNYRRLARKIDVPVRYCCVTFRKMGTGVDAHIGTMLNDHEFLHVPTDETARIDSLTDRVWGRLQTGFYEITCGRTDGEADRI